MIPIRSRIVLIDKPESINFLRTAWNATGPKLAAGVFPYISRTGLRAALIFSTSTSGIVAQILV